MKHLRLGKSDLQISAITMGLWQAGKTYWVGVRDQEVKTAILNAMEVGVTAFDTAEEYGDGYSEKLLGQALGARRKDVTIFSKVFSSHLKRDEVIAACERSLKNLSTDYIDLYQIHWPSGSWGTKHVPIEETMEAMNLLKEQGKIRAIGVSNFSKVQLEEVCKLGQIDSLQPPYSLFFRQIEDEIAPFCLKNQITVLAYSPLAQGFLTGRFRLGHQFKKGDHRIHNKLYANPEIFQKVDIAIDALSRIAAQKKVSLAQLALAWVLSHKNTAAIAGARNTRQIAESAKAAELDLPPSDVENLENATCTVAEHLVKDTVQWTWNP